MVQIAKYLLPEVQRKFKPTDENALGFGNIYSDHMFKADYRDGQWQNPRIEAYGPLLMSPAAMCLHYGQLVFEGLKCYRRQDGHLALFRHQENFKRMKRSAERMCFPPYDDDLFFQGLKEFLLVDQAWVPSLFGSSLYIRPTLISPEPHLGVRPATECLFYIIAGPVGPYYPEGFNPIKIFVEPNYSRVAPGGLGEVKTAANYAASLYATEKAHQKGYTQLLWLDPCEHKYIEEVGSMNMFFVIGDELITAPTNGTVLRGVTRDSILVLAREWGLKVSERPLSIDEVVSAQKSGHLTEAFGSGTAAVVSPVGLINYNGEELSINQGRIGEMTQRFYDEITGVQYGLKPDHRGWITIIE